MQYNVISSHVLHALTVYEAIWRVLLCVCVCTCSYLAYICELLLVIVKSFNVLIKFNCFKWGSVDAQTALCNEYTMSGG